MPRLLIFNGFTADAEVRLSAFGAPTNAVLYPQALSRHAAASAPLEFHELDAANGDRLPQGFALADFDGALITGSPLNVYDDVPEVRRQIELAREVFHAGIPTFGSCWGLQLMSAALGGKVRRNPKGREFGIARNVCLTDAGRAHPMYAGKPAAFDALCSHEDEVEALPPGGRVLAANAISAIQAAEIVDGEKCFWGVQYHPEHVLDYTAAILDLHADKFVAEGFVRDAITARATADDFRAMRRDPSRHDLAWTYGIGADVLDDAARTREFGNWLHTKVIPYAAARG